MSLRAYARHRGVNPNAVTDAIKSGRITRNADGKIDSELADNQWAANTNPGFQRHRKNFEVPAVVTDNQPVVKVGRPADGTASPFIQARTDREFYNAKREQLKYELEARELAPVDRVNGYVSGMIIQAKDVLLRIGPELRDQLAQETDPHRCEVLVMTEIHRALRHLSEYRPNAA